MMSLHKISFKIKFKQLMMIFLVNEITELCMYLWWIKIAEQHLFIRFWFENIFTL